MRVRCYFTFRTVGILLQAWKGGWFLGPTFDAQGLEEENVKNHKVHLRKTMCTVIRVSAGKQDCNRHIIQ